MKTLNLLQWLIYLIGLVVDYLLVSYSILNKVPVVKVVVTVLIVNTLCMLRSGEAERVEMVVDDVVIEVSKHRGIGRMYLTNFR